ncbi:MAG TPA: ABC transporter ATP-binding protein [Acidimicrobiales bacterium]|nr:ABC transporter ATP-binding protein [Acidimicrobiales bacterium]
MNGDVVLAVDDVRFAYGNVPVLFGTDLELRRGEVLGVLGPNGAGKTTLLRVVSGLETPASGAVVHDGDDITAHAPARRAERGLVSVFAGRSTFPDLTVAENLRVSGHILRRTPGLLDERITETFDLFPRLAERRGSTASQLSGGEQQMLALARAFLLHPAVLCIDELSLGLAPTLVDRLSDAVRGFRERGGSVLLVEQSMPVLLQAADRVALMERGTIRQVLADPADLTAALEVLT